VLRALPSAYAPTVKPTTTAARTIDLRCLMCCSSAAVAQILEPAAAGGYSSGHRLAG
jgi:hypothetical protein